MAKITKDGLDYKDCPFTGDAFEQNAYTRTREVMCNPASSKTELQVIVEEARDAFNAICARLDLLEEELNVRRAQVRAALPAVTHKPLSGCRDCYGTGSARDPISGIYGACQCTLIGQAPPEAKETPSRAGAWYIVRDGADTGHIFWRKRGDSLVAHSILADGSALDTRVYAYLYNLIGYRFTNNEYMVPIGGVGRWWYRWFEARFQPGLLNRCGPVTSPELFRIPDMRNYPAPEEEQ